MKKTIKNGFRYGKYLISEPLSNIFLLCFSEPTKKAATINKSHTEYNLQKYNESLEP